jgi:hypothetical protein
MHGMKTMASSLPNDPKQLQAIILQLQQTLAQQESVIITLRHQLSVLKRARFGRSSELLDLSSARQPPKTKKHPVDALHYHHNCHEKNCALKLRVSAQHARVN